MQRIVLHVVATFAFLASLMPLESAAGQRVSTAEKAALQAAMQQHIDRNLVGGKFLHFQPTTGEIRRLSPITAHPMVMTMGPHYVLCADFKTEAGQGVNIDFYLARRGTGYAIFHTAIDDRASLERLMAAGRAQPAD